jgi:hypothetical protein
MKKILSDFLNQAWTLLGMFVAWVVLDGSAKTVVGYAIVITTLLWVVSYKARNPKDDDESGQVS